MRESGDVMTEAPQNGTKGLAKRPGVEFVRTATNILNKEDFVCLCRRDDLAHGDCLFGRERRNPAPYISHELIDFLVRHYGFDSDARNGVMLAFRGRSGTGALGTYRLVVRAG